MAWKYSLVFLGAFIFDVVPIPFPPAFTIMLALQIWFDLNLWTVLFVGVAGSILGRYILSLYIGNLSGKFFKKTKNEDVQFLGKKMKENGWKGQLFILLYSLLPLPTTPLFVAAGMAKLPPLLIIPAFFIGKLTSDTVMLSMGKYATENLDTIKESLTSCKSFLGLAFSLLLLLLLFFTDWRTLLQKHKFRINFNVFQVNKNNSQKNQK
jgi:membrane protein DedA with SNARE-associated domain